MQTFKNQDKMTNKVVRINYMRIFSLPNEFPGHTKGELWVLNFYLAVLFVDQVKYSQLFPKKRLQK